MHPILHHLIEDMNLSTEPFFSKNSPISKAFFLNGKYCSSLEEAKIKLSITADDLQEADVFQSVNSPEHGNDYLSTIKGKAQLARNMTLGHFWSEINNPAMRDLLSADNVGCFNLATYVNCIRPYHGGKVTESYRTIKGGMSLLTDTLHERLCKLGVKLLPNYRVTRIEERGEHGYTVRATSEDTTREIRCDKVMLACGLRGIENITWVSEVDRILQIRHLTDEMMGLGAVKVFLTYRTAWWKNSGIECGTVVTDSPIGTVLLFGERSVSNGYATLMVYSYNHPEMIESLNNVEEEPFANVEGKVSSECIPRKPVVDTIQFHLKKIFSKFSTMQSLL